MQYSTIGAALAEGNIALDTDGNAYVNANVYANSVWAPHIFKYSPQGALLADHTLTVSPPYSDPGIYGVAYSTDSDRIYAPFSYWDAAREGYVAGIRMFDKALNPVKSVIGPSGTDWDYGSVTGIGVDTSSNVYIGGSRSGSFIYMLKYDWDLNLKSVFSKDPVAPKMFVGGETIPNGGYYIINNEDIDNTLHNISASGVEQWFRSSGLDIYIHGVDAGGNFYGVGNSQTPQFSKLGYADGVVKWTMPEPHSAGIDAVFVDGADRIYTAGYLAEPVGDADSYIARYTRRGTPKYSIAKSTATDNQIVTVSTWSAPLVSFVKDDKGNAARDIALTFSISTWPVGATGYELTVLSTNTSSNGFAETQLKLGNIPAEYGVKATCASCEASSNTVTFTCCGKLPNDHFSQGDPAWSTHTYVNSSNTIQARRCALTSLATLSNYYRIAIATAIPNTNPGALNTYLRNNNGYNARNSVRWQTINLFSNTHLRWSESIDIDETTTQRDLVEKADRDILGGRPVVFRVRHMTPGGGSNHFVLGIGKCGSNYIIADPGNRNREVFDPNDPDFTLLGVRLFTAQ